MIKAYYLLYLLLRGVSYESDMIKAAHLEHMVIRPTLARMGEFNPKLNNESAVKLLLGTAAQETDLGYWLHQVGGGPGRGIYSIEPETHADIVHRYLRREKNAGLQAIVEGFVSRDRQMGDDRELVDNFRYSTAIARIKYWMVAAPLPAHDDLSSLAGYWDTYFNANARVGFPREFIDSWSKFVERD